MSVSMVVAHKHQPLSYPVTPDWCDRVRGELKARPRGEMKKLSDHLSTVTRRSISTGHLSDVLSGKYQTSDLVEPIHKWLGWEPPMPPTAAIDAGELMHVRSRLTKAQQTFILDAALIIEGGSGEEARAALESMLKAFRAKND